MPVTVAVVVGIVAGIAAVAWYLLAPREQRAPEGERGARIQILRAWLDEIRAERDNLDRIRRGEHLNPDLRESARWSLLETTFDNIRERAGAVGNRGQYRPLASKIRTIIDARNHHDPVEAVRKMDPLLQRFEDLVEREIRGLNERG